MDGVKFEFNDNINHCIRKTILSGDGFVSVYVLYYIYNVTIADANHIVHYPG